LITAGTACSEHFAVGTKDHSEHVI